MSLDTETIRFSVELTPWEIDQRSLRKALIEGLLPRLGLGPDELRYRDDGSPFLESGRGISLSHKKDKLLVLVTKERNLQVGCDLENLSQVIEWSAFDRCHFSSAELASLAGLGGLSEHEKRLALFSIKEAVYKSFACVPPFFRSEEVFFRKGSADRQIWAVPGLRGDFVSERCGDWISSYGVWEC